MRPPVVSKVLRVSPFALSLGLVACAEPQVVEDDSGVPSMSTLATGAPVTFATVYDAVSYQAGRGVTRPWLPVDLAVHPDG